MKTEITMQHLYNVCEVVFHPTASAFPVRGPRAPAAVPVVSQPVAVTEKLSRFVSAVGKCLHLGVPVFPDNHSESIYL